MLIKVSDNFRDRYEFARTHIKRETVLLQISLICIMAVAILLRFEAAFEYNWALTANDTYSQLIAARAIDANIPSMGFLGSLLNFLTYVDPSMWYPHAGARNFGVTQNLGTPMTAVVVRHVFLLFGINFTIEQAAFLAPAFSGSLTVLVAYFLGKEIANKRVGLLSAFFLSFSPGHLQRSIAGFFDNEAVGVLFMLLTLYLFLRALRTGSFLTSFVSGLSLAGLLLSWGGATYVTQLIALYGLIMLLSKKYSLRLLTAYAGTIVTALSIAVLYPREGPPIVLDINGLVPIGVLGLMIIISIYNNHKDKITSLPFFTSRNLEIASYSFVFGGIGFFLLNFFIPIIPTFRAKFITVVVPFFRDSSPILSSVAEQLIMTWGTMFRNMFLLVFFLPLAVIYLYRKPTENNIFLLVFLMTALYFSGSMVRLILILAPAASFGAAKAVEEILYPYAMVRQEKFFLSKRKRSVSVSIGVEHVSVTFIIMFIVLGFNLLQGLTIAGQIIQPASISMEYKQPNGQIVSYGDWYQALDWMHRNTPQNSVIASWWDYGYWLTLANRTLVTDGATINSTQIGNIGAMLMSSPDYALKIASYYDINYVVVVVAGGSVNLDNDFGKVQWMVKIAEANSNLDKVVGNPINQSNYFNFASDGKSITGYKGDFYKSLIWGIMTDNVDSNTWSNFQNNQLLTNPTQGYQSQYDGYKRVFQPVDMGTNGMTTHNYIRIIKIDWQAAQKYYGVSP